MTVNPGFGGQSFVASMPDKIRRLRETIDRVNPECAIQVDGGINSTTIARVVEAGATSIVAGSSVINGEASIAMNIAALRAAISSQVSTVDASELR
jgi:ribulose-phosphate 3-epimerase